MFHIAISQLGLSHDAAFVNDMCRARSPDNDKPHITIALECGVHAQGVQLVSSRIFHAQTRTDRMSRS